MRNTLVASIIALAALGSQPAAAEGQTLSDLLMSLRNGGGWVSIPIEAGHGALSTATLPTAGMSVSGCVQVWWGHSGAWDILARDALGEGLLEVHAQPGQPVVFSYAAGLRSQLEVDVRWSEPRDTTLLLWVGLDRPGRTKKDSCDPAFGS